MRIRRHQLLRTTVAPSPSPHPPPSPRPCRSSSFCTQPSSPPPTYLPNQLPTYLHTYLPIYIPTYPCLLPNHLTSSLSPTYLPIHSLTYPPTYRPTYIPTHLPIYLPTYLPIHPLTDLQTWLFYSPVFPSGQPAVCNTEVLTGSAWSGAGARCFAGFLRRSLSPPRPPAPPYHQTACPKLYPSRAAPDRTGPVIWCSR